MPKNRRPHRGLWVFTFKRLERSIATRVSVAGDGWTAPNTHSRNAGMKTSLAGGATKPQTPISAFVRDSFRYRKNTPFLSTSITAYLSNKWGAVHIQELLSLNYYMVCQSLVRSATAPVQCSSCRRIHPCHLPPYMAHSSLCIDFSNSQNDGCHIHGQ